MASQLGSVVVLGLLLVVGCAATSSVGQSSSTTPTHFDVTSLNRSSFPVGFTFGTASSSYQYEGAARQGGKGLSIWDTFTHKYPEKIKDRSNGDIAVDEYHRYKEDVGIMKEMNLDAYRFSISWPRLLPKGKLSGGVNQIGINYYNNLINELLAKGLTPYVTLFHWDLPQALEDEYGGFLSPLIVEDFKDYAELCFKEFGDRVKHWITLNEPWSFSSTGYAAGIFAPGRCSDWQQLNCTGGDSGTEPYWVGHHLILAHAAAVKVYKHKYQASQKGVIGITLVSFWFIPYSQRENDQKAAQRALDFMLGWFLNPLTFGEYPHSMRVYVGKRLPKFKPEEVKLVKGSFDFLGLNYYTSFYALDQPRNQITDEHYSFTTDPQVLQTPVRDGVPIGPKNGSDWIFVYPRGIYDLLLYVKKNYHNPIIYITENGIDEINNSTMPLAQALSDVPRISYHQGHLSFLLKAIKHGGVKVKGYFAWSLLDNFEWHSGYTVRFGINYVDYKHRLKRYPKLSAHWFKAFLKK